MANIEDTCISLTNPIEADSSSATKLSDSLDIVILPSTTTITTNSNVSNNKEIHPRSVKKQKIADNILLSNISRRLAIRKNLHKRLSFITDIMCFLGILGIILMIIENEITFSQINNNDTMSSWCIKMVISCSTIILIGFIFQYHRLKLFLYAVNNSIQDSRATLTNRKIFLIILEILICAIHPVPHSTPPYLKASLKNIDSNSSISTPYILSYIDIDVALGLPSITAIIGLVGVFSTALVIAVLAQKLLLDRCEKYVHNFVMNIELAKEHKIQAANCVKFAVKVWYMKNRNTSLSSIRYLQVRRRLFQAIHLVQQVKQERGKLIDNCIDQIDLLTMQRKTNAQTYETKEQLKTMKVKIDNIEEKLIEMNTNINNTVNDIQKILNILSAKFLK
ncbi:unnamed protein product [Rotaria sordida]|uniref:Calmodulin-binding domain-containing protein n=1 Tax=Rotaria sordida TaxID=392033 RepID=A0A819WVB8_9BILA|nr:unnamed protein product [Rotaria sordida]